MSKPKKGAKQPVLTIASDVLRSIRGHAHSHMKTEVCGVLIGSETEDGPSVHACIAGVNATQGGTHVTFTQDAWEHIYSIKDKEYPDDRIIGWYHSHPGFGVFLSDHDIFIHKNFFSSPSQVAWVYDPHSEEEGCFQWVNGEIRRCTEIAVADSNGGGRADAVSRSEPVYSEDDEEDAAETKAEERSVPAWLQWTTAIVSHICVAVLGFVLAMFLIPPVVVPVPVDPRTGHPLDPRTGQPLQQDEQGRYILPSRTDRAPEPMPTPKETRDKNGQQ